MAQGWDFLEPLRAFHNPETQGFCYSLDAATGEFDYVHSEITGLALSLMSRFERRVGGGVDPAAAPEAHCSAESAVGDLARGAARFLLDAQLPEGGFRHSLLRHPSLPERSREVHVFDTAICALALLDCAEAWGEGPYRRAAERAADWLISEAQHPEGWFRAVWLNDQREWGDFHRAGFWSSAGGCYHGRLLAFLPRLDRWAETNRLLGWLLKVQGSEGAWPASPTQPRVHTHAMCYALEGLLSLHSRTGESAALDAVRKGVGWLSSRAIEHDGIPTWAPSRQLEFRSDVQRQFLRILGGVGDCEPFEEAQAACRRRLERLCAAPGRWRLSENGTSAPPRLASWTTVFDLADRLPSASIRERLV